MIGNWADWDFPTTLLLWSQWKVPSTQHMLRQFISFLFSSVIFLLSTWKWYLSSPCMDKQRSRNSVTPINHFVAGIYLSRAGPMHMSTIESRVEQFCYLKYKQGDTVCICKHNSILNISSTFYPRISTPFKNINELSSENFCKISKLLQLVSKWYFL